MTEDLFELRVKGAQPLVDVLGIGRQVAFQLQEAHRRGRVHGQITLRSVELVEGEAVLRFPDPPLDRSGLTAEQVCVGNIAHVLAPEQLSEWRLPFDPAVDLYPLGVILYELSSGAGIYRRVRTTMEAVRAKLEGDLVPLRERDPSLPTWFTGFVDDLLALDSDRRPRADEAHRLLKREHMTALLARHRPRRTTPPVPIPDALTELYEIVKPIGPAGRSGQVWEYLALPRDGAKLVVLQVSHADEITEVYPFVEGETLADRLKRLGPLPTPDVVTLGRQVADALAHLHEHGPHGCLTPERVRIDFDERFHLTGAFPLATRHPATEVDALELSPEHLTPNVAEEVDRASDLYGLGLVLFAAVTGGELPYPGDDRLARLRSKRDGRRIQLRGRRHVPRRLGQLIDLLLDSDPRRRPTPDQIEQVLARC